LSINAMTRVALLRAGKASGGKVPQEPMFSGASATGTGEASTSAPLDALARYIPTEAIALYLALLGTIGANTSGYVGRWVAFGVFLVATPLFVFIDWKIKSREASRPDLGLARKLLTFNLIAATLAFAAWGFSLPASPFGALSFYDERWAGFVAPAVSVALGKAEALVLPLSQGPQQAFPQPRRQ
jgi:hypothetical protein